MAGEPGPGDKSPRRIRRRSFLIGATVTVGAAAIAAAGKGVSLGGVDAAYRAIMGGLDGKSASTDVLKKESSIDGRQEDIAIAKGFIDQYLKPGIATEFNNYVQSADASGSTDKSHHRLRIQKDYIEDNPQTIYTLAAPHLQVPDQTVYPFSMSVLNDTSGNLKKMRFSVETNLLGKLNQQINLSAQYDKVDMEAIARDVFKEDLPDVVSFEPRDPANKYASIGFEKHGVIQRDGKVVFVREQFKVEDFGRAHVEVEYSDVPFELEKISREVTGKDVKDVKQSFQKYINSDADREFWKHLQELDPSEIKAAEVGDKTQYEITMREDGSGVVFGAPLLVEIDKQGGLRLSGKVYKNGRIASHHDGSYEEVKITNTTDMEKVGNNLFNFLPGSSEQDRWRVVDVKADRDPKFDPRYVPGVEAVTESFDGEVVYRVTEEDRFEVLVTPKQRAK